MAFGVPGGAPDATSTPTSAARHAARADGVKEFNDAKHVSVVGMSGLVRGHGHNGAGRSLRINLPRRASGV